MNWDIAALAALLKIINNDDSFLDHLRDRSNEDLAHIAEVAGALASAAKDRMVPALPDASSIERAYAPHEVQDFGLKIPLEEVKLPSRWEKVARDLAPMATTPGDEAQSFGHVLTDKGIVSDPHYDTCADPKLCAETGSHPFKRHDLAPVGHHWADAETEQRGIQAHRTPEPYGGYEGNMKGSE